jgi:hypothetical protein
MNLVAAEKLRYDITLIISLACGTAWRSGRQGRGIATKVLNASGRLAMSIFKIRYVILW